MDIKKRLSQSIAILLILLTVFSGSIVVFAADYTTRALEKPMIVNVGEGSTLIYWNSPGTKEKLGVIKNGTEVYCRACPDSACKEQ